MARTLDHRNADPTAPTPTGRRFARLCRRRFIRLGALTAGFGLTAVAQIARGVTGRDAAAAANSLTIVGTADPATYEITVSSDAITRGLRSSPDPEIYGSTIEGAIATGVKRYHFDGEIEHARFSGDVDVYLDGQPVTPDSI